MTESSGAQRQKRGERARRNGSKGRGAAAATGAAQAKLNGLEWGLRAQTYPLPGEEDADAAAQARYNAWYGPASPAAGYHARQCARADVIGDRCERFIKARIADQKRKAVRNFQRRGPRRVKSLIARIPQDRLGSFQAMTEFSDGCQELASVLAGALKRLSSQGHLLPAELDTVFWAHGIGPAPKAVLTDVTAYTLSILNFGGTPGVAAAERDARLDPAVRPPALRELPREALMPADPQVCTERLRALIQQKLDEYQAEADRLKKEYNEPELARMLDEAEFLSDADAKRWKRCHAEQRLTFRSSEPALYKALDRDREDCDDRNEEPGTAGGAIPEPQTAPGECEPPGPEGAGRFHHAERDAYVDCECEPPAWEGAGRAGEGVGRPLAGSECVSPREPRIAPEASPQMMDQREDRAQEAGTGQGVPLGVPGGAADGHDAAPAPAVQPFNLPPLGAGLPTPASSGPPLGAGLPTPASSGPDISERGRGHNFGPCHGGRLPPWARAWSPGGGGHTFGPLHGGPGASGPAFPEAPAPGGAAALTRPSATLSQGERDWTAAHADPPGGPDPAPHTQ